MSGRFFAIAALSLTGLAALNALSAGDALYSVLAAPAEAAESAEDPEEETVVEADVTEATDGEPDMAEAEEGEVMEAAAGAAASCPRPSFAEEIGASPEEFRVLSSLQARRREIDQMESEAETRIQLAAAAEQRVDERIAELKTVQAEVQGLLGQLDEAEEERMAGLVTMYEKMKSKDAARILSALEPETALLVVARMKDSTLASVLGDMETADAKRLTEMIAENARIKPSATAALNDAAGEG